MMILVTSLFVWIFHCCMISIDGINNDITLSMLTTNQIQVWLKAISQINQDPAVVILRLDSPMEIPLYNDRDGIDHKNRHLFKQNINKQVNCYLFENQLNSSISLNIYDQCHGTLILRNVQKDIAGIYVYTGNEVSYGLGIILFEITNSFQWFNGTKFYSFDQQSNLKNGTQLSLAFETLIYYNSNSDIILCNNKINNIIQQANVLIINDDKNNLETFFHMENLSCQQHQQIVDNDLRLLTFVCITKVTFICPLQIGSTCWIENKRMSNIVLNIDSLYFPSDKTITVRIDV
ncbi:unnamed protein product [Adineta steineri]|uniref:Transmembrane protein n=1 Tax=Adineta steineri TaxID=433720 RepID=A0A818LPK0_9BILA|nr:unnamed protein product [Adineta steineri]CAF3576458.1 unnamed protein product [Adineta steineri]